MEDTYNKQLSRKCYYACLVICAIGMIISLVLHWFGIELTELNPTPCVLYTLFGLYCPGCGGTRAMECFLRGEYWKSFVFHPVVLYTAILIGAFVVSHTLNIMTKGRIKAMLFRGIYLYLMLAIIVIQCVVKNILKLVFLIEIC